MAKRDNQSSATALPNLLDIEQVCAFFGGSKPLKPATIYRGMAATPPIYPKPIKVAPNSNRWSRDECEIALAKMIEQRDVAA